VHNIFTKFTAFFFPFTHNIKSVTTKRKTFSQPYTLHHFTKNMCTLLLICCSWTQTVALTAQ